MREKGGRGKEMEGGKRLIFTFLYLNPLTIDDKCTHRKYGSYKVSIASEKTSRK